MVKWTREDEEAYNMLHSRRVQFKTQREVRLSNFINNHPIHYLETKYFADYLIRHAKELYSLLEPFVLGEEK